MPNRVTISAAQLGASYFSNGEVDKKGNVLRILALLEKAIREEVQIVCFPELSLTDYFAVRIDWDFERYFDQLPNELTKNIFDLTRDHPISVILPYAEYDGVTYYNTAGIIQQGQLLGKYRKMHIASAFIGREYADEGPSNFEKQYFTPGDLGYPVFDLQGVKVGIQICYDRFFPEGYRALALKGAQLVFTPTALPTLGLEWRETSWEPILRVRSLENNIFVIGVNKAGIEKGLKFSGNSVILNPVGSVVAKIPPDKGESLLTAEIDLDDIIEAKKIFPLFRDRIPADYQLFKEASSRAVRMVS